MDCTYVGRVDTGSKELLEATSENHVEPYLRSYTLKQHGNDMVLGGVRFFDLAQTLDNGQAFRWRALGGENGARFAGRISNSAGDASATGDFVDGASGFAGIVYGRRVEIFRRDASISDADGTHGRRADYVIKDMTMEEFRGTFAAYFGLDEDYAALRGLFFEHGGEPLRKAMEFSPGLRLMRQDVWEVLVSFILSQNSNIPRIKKMVETLCACFGDEIPNGGQSRKAGNVAGGERCGATDVHKDYYDEARTACPAGYTFPTPQALAALDITDLAPVRAGYRAAYILDAARRVASGDFDIAALAAAPTEDIYRELLKIHGVGPKVADCVLLYGFGRTERYPTDVWIKRAMAKFYPHGFSEEVKPHAGVAQQFLFHYIRNMNS